MDVVEMVRYMSVVIGRPVDPVKLFDNGEYMDDILSQLLCLFYDIKLKKPWKHEFITFTILTARKLGFEGHFTLNDFSEQRERSRWVPFLSVFVSWFDCDFTEVLEVVDSSSESRNMYKELLESNRTRECELQRLQEAECERRERIKGLEAELCRFKSCYAEKNAMAASREDLYRSLVSSCEEKKHQIESYKDKLQRVNEDYESLQYSLIDNCESLPKLISEIEIQLDNVESDIHGRFEALNRISDLSSVLQKYLHLITTEFKPKFDQVYALMNKLDGITNDEKEYAGKVDLLNKDNKKMQAAVEEVDAQFAEYHSHTVRRRLLLNNRKKAYESDNEERSKKINSFEAEEEALAKQLSGITRCISCTMKQIDEEEKELQEVSKCQISFEQLNKVLLDLNQIVERTSFSSSSV
uniref:Uncharacterized protein n=1 Tax=Trichobilharzia regenti TaxID=157069 RepID=A0AA85KF92_TRIRE|nr:unnamed protein product [Trichobilharzia regenti]